MRISVFKDLYKSKEVPYIVDLEKVIQRIKVGKSKDVIDRIRKAETKELKSSLKNTLPSILFAGEFTQRNSNSLVQHSGLMVVDFDNYPDDKDMFEHLELLKQNPHFVLLFLSPGGKGIKGVVKIPPATKDTHPKYFKAFQHTFKYEYFDISNSNVDRVCFESYDPDIYVNYDAEPFEIELTDTGYTRTERIPLLPVDDEDMIIERIMRFNWKKGFKEGERNSFVFDLAGAFCEYGVSLNTAIGYIQNNVTYGDFSDKECETAIKSAYRTRAFNTKFFENYTKIDKIKVDLKKGKKEVVKEHKITPETFDAINESFEHDDFWDINEKGKVVVSSIKYKLFLERNGFKKYFPANNLKSILVRVISNKVDVTSVEVIKDFVLGYLLDKKEFQVYDFCAKYENLFSEKYLIMLDTIDLVLLQDTATKSYIGFRNGILEVTQNKTKLIDYIDVNGYIWSSHILNRDFAPLDDHTNDYQKFIYNISNSEPAAIECTLGYLVSTYKNRSNNKAVILNDEVISDNPEGGTGKGLVVQGLQQIRRVSIIDGKSFDEKKAFPYQTVQPDCQILVFDDVNRNFNFENNFSLVTEGITIEKKNKDAIKLSVTESPKLVISTNYAIKGEGNSHDRRRQELEVAQYYNGKRTPYQEFGKQLFDEWTPEEFQRFDNYMVYCLQSFLKNGLITQQAKNIRMRKFIAETSMEFYEFAQERDNLQFNERLDKQVKFEAFTNEYQDFKKFLSRKKFQIWIQKYAKFIGAEYEAGSSNGFHWFEITTADKKTVDSKELEDELAF
jgi:hypothetical protein